MEFVLNIDTKMILDTDMEIVTNNKHLIYYNSFHI